MSETPQKHRKIVREEVDALKPFDSVMYSVKLMRSLVNDADRLAKAEALLSAAKCPDCDGSGVVVHSVTRPYPECCGIFLDGGECCGELVAVPVEEGEPGPCQWCHEREGLLWGTSDD